MNINPLTWLGKSQNGSADHGVRITFAKSTVGRTMSRAGVLMRKQIWVWPIMAIILLSIIGVVVHSSIESTMQSSLRTQVAQENCIVVFCEPEVR